jgi:hypothetical protein
VFDLGRRSSAAATSAVTDISSDFFEPAI